MPALAQFGTFSKNPATWGFPVDTTVICALGACVTLNDNRQYLDWTSGLGSSILGFCDPGWADRVSIELLRTGGSLSLPSHLEARVAEQLCTMLGNHVPGWQTGDISARFAKTGSDVTTMAVRLVRAVTGRDWILTAPGNYHGWHDWTIGRTPPAWGIVEVCPAVAEVDLHNLDRLSEWTDDVAAVILEQGINDPAPGYYDNLRQWCDEHGILLIVDEVVTGLRYGLGGACERYGIKPDLVCMGKALGNGLPVSALVGRAEYMAWFARNDPVFCSSTFWGESVGLAAAKYVLSVWDAEKVTHLWHIGNRLMDGLRQAGWNVVGHGARSVLNFDSDQERAFFIQGMKEAGVLINRPNLPTMAHTTNDVAHTVGAATELREWFNGLGPGELDWLTAGKLPQVLFKNR